MSYYGRVTNTLSKTNKNQIYQLDELSDAGWQRSAMKGEFRKNIFSECRAPSILGIARPFHLLIQLDTRILNSLARPPTPATPSTAFLYFSIYHLVRCRDESGPQSKLISPVFIQKQSPISQEPLQPQELCHQGYRPSDLERHQRRMLIN